MLLTPPRVPLYCLPAHDPLSGLPVAGLTRETWGEGLDAVDHLSAGPPEHGEPMRQHSQLRAETEPAVLGEVTAFVSYTWADDNDAQFAQIQAWAVEQPAPPPGGRPMMIWIDRACFDIDDISLSLACLPIFVAGCQKLLVLAGPKFASRLWCAMVRARPPTTR